MALTTAVFVGKSKEWLPELADRAKNLKIGAGVEKDVDICPVAHSELKDRINMLLNTVEKEGGKFVLDGRGYKHPKYPNGNFIAPSIIEVDGTMTAY